MAFVSFQNTCLVELVMTQFGNARVNTLYIEQDSAWSNVTMGLLSASIITWWKNEPRALMSNTVTLTTCRVRSLESQFGLVIEESVTAGNVGAITTPALPGNVTCTVKFLTGFAGRRRRGRNFWVGLCEPQVGEDVVDPDIVAGMIAAYEQLNGSLVGGTNPRHVVASRAGIDPEVGGEGMTVEVISYASDGVVDSQRRRLHGRGA